MKIRLERARHVPHPKAPTRSPRREANPDENSYADVLLSFRDWCERTGRDFRPSVIAAVQHYQAVTDQG